MSAVPLGYFDPPLNLSPLPCTAGHTGRVKIHGWNNIPAGYGLTWDPSQAPRWLRLWLHTPLLDRFAFPVMIRRGHAWFSPSPGWDEAPVRIQECPLCGGEVDIGGVSGLMLGNGSEQWSESGSCMECQASLVRELGDTDRPIVFMKRSDWRPLS
jgi:hypothetical protein